MDSIIHHLNNWGQDYTKICSAASLIDNNVILFSSACTGSISNSSGICYVISKFFQRKNIFSLFAFECDFFRHFLRYTNSLL